MTNHQTASPGKVRKREATCDAILRATSVLIAEKGVAGFTMSDVAERGKVNRALIYHYYHDRDNLVLETIRYIVDRYDEVHAADGNDELEQTLRLHIEHPEIGRFFLHLMLTGKPLPKLSRRITNAIRRLEELKATNAAAPTVDPVFAVISGWLMELAWSGGREEIARLLGLSLQEADQRFIADVRNEALLIKTPARQNGN